MLGNIQKTLESEPVESSAPCRVDMGGTLDISTFYYPLRHLSPLTFNFALNLRTHVKILPYKKNMVKVSSKGFKSAAFNSDEAPYNHPLGLMFAIAGYYGVSGTHIDIESTSPPRSALGGSSAAAVALIGGLEQVKARKNNKILSSDKIARLAHAIEESVAGVPCGLQDQLASVFGGINAWYWRKDINGALYRQKSLLDVVDPKKLEKHLILVYTGVPHESKNVNAKWVSQFVAGENRKLWHEVVLLTHTFIQTLSETRYQKAAEQMNKETEIRVQMTPDVLDDMGKNLVEVARDHNCGARFTGAGGGGCIWALGRSENIDKLKDIWEILIHSRKDAFLLDVKIDTKGLRLK